MQGTWVQESSRAMWKFPELGLSSPGSGVGSIRARFQLKDGPGYQVEWFYWFTEIMMFCLCQGTIAAQFNCEGTTLSGVEFELSGSGYRVSLVKRRFVSGRTSNLRRFKQLCHFPSNSSNRELCVSLSGKLSSVKSLKCSFFSQLVLTRVNFAECVSTLCPLIVEIFQSNEPLTHGYA